ncbi:MAG: MFS transporter [Chlamydiales bacterium]|nr:MFS transporter [Chlamydiales bacterium]
MKIKPFTFLNATQFLGVFNDNLFKLLLIFALINIQGIKQSQTILSLAGAIFVLPFLVLSIPAGTLADRISKKVIIIYVKAIELAAAILGVISFGLESALGLYSALFILAISGAIFGPTKYGIVPELVKKEELSKSNGYLSSFTFLAIIIGTSAAGPLVEASDRNYFFASFACLILAIIGMLTAIKIPHTPAASSSKKFTPFFFLEVIHNLKEASNIKYLLVAIFGSAYFLFIGGFTQLNIIPYAVYCLGLSEIEGSYLFLITALGIGIGSLVAGKLSGKKVQLGLSPIGALGMSISALTLSFCELNFYLLFLALFFLGAFGGIYLIPLDSYIQAASPNNKRGQNVAANNLMGFTGVLFASFLLYLIGNILGFSANIGFMCIGIITAFVTLLFFYLLRFPLKSLFGY